MQIWEKKMQSHLAAAADVSCSKAAMELCQSGSSPGGWEGKTLLTVWARDQGSLFHKFRCLKVKSGRCQETLDLHEKGFCITVVKKPFSRQYCEVPYFFFT